MSEDFAPWSLSKANVAKTCSLRFHYQYRLRTRQRQIKSNAGRIGAAVHEYIDGVLRGKDIAKTYLNACMKNKLTLDEQLTLDEFREPTQRFVTRINAFMDKKRAQGYDVTLASEKPYMFERDGTQVSEWFSDASYWRGLVDAEVTLLKDGERAVYIFDHKTGRPSHEKTTAYQAQVQSYAVAAAITYPDLVGVKTAVHWLREDHDDDIFSWSAYMPAAHIHDELIPWFYAFYDGAQAATQQEPAPQPGEHCTWCGYKHLCPLYRVPQP